MIVMLVVGTMATFSSCSKDDDDDTPDTPQEPVITSTNVTVVNNTGTYTFRSFTFVFKNRNDETISQKDCGTIGNNDRTSAKIPTGCSYFYFGFYIGSYLVVSPNYYIDDQASRNISVTEEMVTSWDAYDSSSAPQKISTIR